MVKKTKSIAYFFLCLCLAVFCEGTEAADIHQLQGCWLGYWDIDFYGGKCWIGLEINVRSEKRIDIDFHRIQGLEEHEKCRKVSFHEGVLRFELPSRSYFQLEVDLDGRTMQGHLRSDDWLFPTYLAFDPEITDVKNNGRFFKDQSYTYRIPEQIDDGLICGSVQSSRLDFRKLDELMSLILNGSFEDIRSILLYKDGKLVLEEYFWRKTVGGFPYIFRRDEFQNIYSATRTFTAALAGISIDKKFIPGVDAKIFSFFPEYSSILGSDDKKKITIEDLLSMEAGFQWGKEEQDEYQPLFDQIRSSGGGQIIEYLFQRPMSSAPGKKYVYNNEVSTVLGEIVSRSSSLPLLLFVDKHLFAPLGIKDYSWHVYPDGIVSAGNGLKMKPRDMIKFGSLFVNGGQWQGHRIIPRDWVNQSFERRTDYGDNPYGYHWWLDTFNIGGQRILCPNARGHYGQFIFVLPALGMVCVVTSAENENHRWDRPLEMLSRYIIPASLPIPSATSFSRRKERIEKEAFASYQGIYKHQEGRYGIVGPDGRSLRFKPPGLPSLRLVASSDTVFFSRKNDIQLTFPKSLDGTGSFHYDLIMNGVEEEAVKIQVQPERRINDKIVFVPWIALILCGTCSFVMILLRFALVLFEPYRNYADKDRLVSKMNRFSPLKSIWAGMAVLGGIWIITEILNDRAIIEEILNFGLYIPGWDELSAGWIFMILSLGMVLFAFSEWKKKEGTILSRIIFTCLAVSLIYLNLIFLFVGIFVLIP